MTLQEQLGFLDELETRFLHLDKTFSSFPTYDGEYGEMASKVGEVIESLWRLSSLEK